MSETMSITGLQTFGPKSQPEDQGISPDTNYDHPDIPTGIVLAWDNVAITPGSSTGTFNLSGTEGTSLSFSGSSSGLILTFGSTQFGQFSTDAQTAFVNAAWDTDVVMLTYMAFTPSTEPATVGVWMGTSSGGDESHCPKGHKAYTPAKPQA